MNISERILHFGKTRAQSIALIESDREVTYGELAQRVRRTSSHLAALGVRPGDRVGLCLGDSADHITALLATALLGAVSVPLDWRASAAENGRFIDALGLEHVLTEPHTLLPESCSAAPLDEEWRRLVAAADECDGMRGDWHDGFVISATSGSTGAPKFTLMSHLQYHFAAAGMLELMDLAGHHRYLSTLPLYYSAGRNSCIAHLLRGDCIVLYPSIYSATEYVDIVERERITVGAVVPSAVRQLLAVGGEDVLLPRLAKMFCSGAPLHAEEKRRAARCLSAHFHERYGTAETLALSILAPQDFETRADSVGQPHSLVEVEIIDDGDQPLPAGESGRVRIRGPGVARPLPGAGAQSSFRDGWYYPGEIASLDEQGYIFLRGRTSDVIMRSGAKIFPAEIEAALVEHSGILEAAVLGHRGADLEETVVAFVVPRGDTAVGTILAHCRGRLTPHKVPREIRFLSQMPRNTSGKIDKAVLAKYLNSAPAG